MDPKSPDFWKNNPVYDDRFILPFASRTPEVRIDDRMYTFEKSCLKIDRDYVSVGGLVKLTKSESTEKNKYVIYKRNYQIENLFKNKPKCNRDSIIDIYQNAGIRQMIIKSPDGTKQLWVLNNYRTAFDQLIAESMPILKSSEFFKAKPYMGDVYCVDEEFLRLVTFNGIEMSQLKMFMAIELFIDDVVVLNDYVQNIDYDSNEFKQLYLNILKFDSDMIKYNLKMDYKGNNVIVDKNRNVLPLVISKQTNDLLSAFNTSNYFISSAIQKIFTEPNSQLLKAIMDDIGIFFSKQKNKKLITMEGLNFFVPLLQNANRDKNQISEWKNYTRFIANIMRYIYEIQRADIKNVMINMPESREEMFTYKIDFEDKEYTELLKQRQITRLWSVKWIDISSILAVGVLLIANI